MTDIEVGIGHNKPPKTPFEAAKDSIETLHLEATNWLDGEAIKNQGQADAVSKLLGEARTAKKEADAARKVENKPFDEGKTEVQGRYNPILKRADTIADICKKVLAPFIAKIDDEKREAERIAREEADAAEAKAQEALANAKENDLAAREEAERYVDDAKAAKQRATRAAKDKGAAKGGTRAVTLRTIYVPSITDLTAAARHYWTTDRKALEALIFDLVKRDVYAGSREIPGVTITEERVAQ